MSTKIIKNIDIRNTVGGRLKLYRASRGHRMVDFAGLAGISQGSLSGIENDKSRPSSDTLANLIMNTDINIEWLLTGKGEMSVAAGKVCDNSGKPPITDEDPMVAELLAGARRVLESGDPLAFDALARNIRYFNHAVATEKRLAAVEAKMEELLKTLSAPKARQPAATE